MDFLHFGALADWSVGLITAITAAALLLTIFVGGNLWIVAATMFALSWLFGAPWWLWTLTFAPTVVLLVPALRRWLLSDRILDFFVRSGFMPQISDTERAAIAWERDAALLPVLARLRLGLELARRSDDERLASAVRDLAEAHVAEAPEALREGLASRVALLRDALA